MGRYRHARDHTFSQHPAIALAQRQVLHAMDWLHQLGNEGIGVGHAQSLRVVALER